MEDEEDEKDEEDWRTRRTSWTWMRRTRRRRWIRRTRKRVVDVQQGMCGCAEHEGAQQLMVVDMAVPRADMQPTAHGKGCETSVHRAADKRTATARTGAT